MTGESDKNKPAPMTEVVYKLRTSVATPGDIAESHRNVVGTLLRYIEKHMELPLPSCAWRTDSFHCENNDMIADCVCLPKRHLWALRFFHAGQMLWNFGMIERRGVLDFGMEAARSGECKTSHHDMLKSLSGVLDLKAEIPFGGECLHPSSDEQLQELWRLICSPARRFPIIVVSELYPSSLEWAPYGSRYQVKPAALAARLFGSAGIAVLDHQAARRWTALFGREHAAFDGAVRTFYPISAAPVIPGDHPLILKGSIREYDAGERPGYPNFSAFLESGIARSVGRKFVNWDGLFFYDSAMVLLEECTRITGRKRGRPKAEKSDETLLEERYRATQKELSRLRHRLHIQTPPEPQPPRPAKTPPRPAAPAPAQEQAGSYAELNQWIKNTLAGKVYLHPRAERSLLKAQYRSVELIRQALALLAHEYRDCRLGKMDDKIFRKKCQELGLSYRRSISLVRATAENDTYFIDYPPEKPRRRFLKFKLSKGISHQPRYCLRIYFFWDAEKQLVVVGSLPHHLSNRTT